MSPSDVGSPSGHKLTPHDEAEMIVRLARNESWITNACRAVGTRSVGAATGRSW
jgi:hypothetical protein